MCFPSYTRVIYEHNPLYMVVFELFFPKILKITGDQLINFHEKIRDQYPIYRIDYPIDIPDSINDLKSVDFLNELLSNETSYFFISENLNEEITLTNNSISFSTKDYRNYEEFWDKLSYIWKIFNELYRLLGYFKITLRYQNLIIPSNLQLEPQWENLIASHLVAELSLKEISSTMKAMKKSFLLEIEDFNIDFNHGIIGINSSSQDLTDTAYLIDTYFFIETEDLLGEENVNIYCTKFNKIAGQIFRWSITEKLHQAMLPRTI